MIKEERACAQNFLLDERPSPEALDLYKPHLDPGESDAPVTFRPLNDRNRVTQIDTRLNLIRIEQADWPCALRGDAFEEVADQIKEGSGW